MQTIPAEFLSSKKAIFSLGGSLVCPDHVDVAYLTEFRKFVLKKLEEGWQFTIVIGGGTQARRYIEAASEVMGKEITSDDKDWLGIHATRFNAHLVRTIFRSVAQPALIIDPEEDVIDAQYKVIVAAGWKPGWSTDFVATKLATRLQAPLVFNLTNIEQVYTADPKKDPNATPVEKMLWSDFRKMVGDEWVPGMNAPYDPIAARLASEHDITVAVMNGVKLDNLESALSGGEFLGTTLSTE
jgi:uridylate kinase